MSEQLATRAAPPTPTFAYLPWMDGMRAFAVAAVMVFHAEITQPSLHIQSTIGGGLLGVDVFFAISGFLITTLLLIEFRRADRISYGAFYLRRARRLLPALAVLLVTIVAVTLVADTGHHRAVGLEHVGYTVAYSADFVEAGRTAGMGNLSQTWSLAIEEQFYLLWPAALVVLLILGRKRETALLAGLTTLLVASIAYVGWAAHHNWTYMRVYYAPDTRVGSLLIGAVLGAAYVTGRLPRGPGIAWVRRVTALAGVVLIGVLLHNPGWPVSVAVRHHWKTWISPAEDCIYMLTALATALIIWELIESQTHLGHRVLSTRPAVALGRISYGLYLWDGTFASWITARAMGFGGWWLVAFHVAATLTVATASWFLVERHFMKRARPVVRAAGT